MSAEKKNVCYSYLYKGQLQNVRWSREQLQDYLNSYVVKIGNPADAYEIIEVTETRLGPPKVGITF